MGCSLESIWRVTAAQPSMLAKGLGESTVSREVVVVFEHVQSRTALYRRWLAGGDCEEQPDAGGRGLERVLKCTNSFRMCVLGVR